MRRALVTGAAGFAGRHLVEHLRGQGMEVCAAGHGAEVEVDFRDLPSVAALFARARPDLVFHLAGTSSLADMQRDPTGGQANIVGPALHVLEATLKVAPAARVVLVSTCHVYGRAERLPIPESSPLRPTDLYGAARASVERLAEGYGKKGVHYVIARAFHHTGPGQDRRFALADWAAQAVGGARVVRVGDLDVARDYTDVRDVVRGYALLAERGAAGQAYNLCAGRAYTMRELFRLVVGPGVEAEVDPARLRKAEVPVFYGDPGRIEALGWGRAYTIEETLTALRGDIGVRG